MMRIKNGELTCSVDVELDIDDIIDELEDNGYIVSKSSEATKEDWRQVFGDDTFNRNRHVAETVAGMFHQCNDDPQMLREIIAELTCSSAVADKDELCDRLKNLL